MDQRPPGAQRFVSVDAMRGITVGAMIFVNDPGDWSHVFGPFGHASWHGCTPTDLIFPTFLFIVGVSLALAGGPRLETGGDVAALQRAWWWRSLRIVLLGWALAAVAVLSLPNSSVDPVPWRPLGVLPRIGICFGLVGWLYLHSAARTRWLVYAMLLASYGALLSWWGDLTRDHSLPSRVDARVLGAFAYHYNPATGLGYDPEGLLSTLGALSNTVLGALCGDWLRRRALRPIVIAGAVLVAAGLLLNRVWMPMNKALWTPPFALFSGGFSALALVLVHTLVERWHVPPYGRRFGVNAITAYAGSILMVCLLDGTPLHRWLYDHAFDPLIPLLGAKPVSHLYAALQLLFWWGVVWWMDKRRIRLSI
ncbi:acyltransferase family protein [Ideonella sp.]|uniref:acyltransferase family protein n=1 Tax=Ideonella sp. TaxID=1929293 RepID=UPI002B4A7A07|nr:heparan-alpha-glucosaminide N-acetyltransferase domain-containing protein [Ideonella sp.]HJV71385.1 heparan-alpha-glucosaminide N-acetyltransferase domain-containing protein [Ideonella sp.]